MRLTSVGCHMVSPTHGSRHVLTVEIYLSERIVRKYSFLNLQICEEEEEPRLCTTVMTGAYLSMSLRNVFEPCFAQTEVMRNGLSSAAEPIFCVVFIEIN